MSITYQFNVVDDEQTLRFTIDKAQSSKPSNSAKPAAWTALAYCQCSNCPLSKAEHTHCPAALDMEPIVNKFRALPGIRKADVIVTTEDREYRKRTGLEEGLRSLMGLVMANSDCPILSNLRPMAVTHLPFSNQSEFIIRSAGTYLLRQYFNHKDGEEADWDLEGLVKLNQELQLVNQAVWQRVHSACEGDSNLKALLSFFTLSSSVSYSLESQLKRLKKEFLNETDPLHEFEDLKGS